MVATAIGVVLTCSSKVASHLTLRNRGSLSVEKLEEDDPEAAGARGFGSGYLRLIVYRLSDCQGGLLAYETTLSLFFWFSSITF